MRTGSTWHGYFLVWSISQFSPFNKTRMEQQSTILEGYSAQEKAAYLGAIASVATADRSASDVELAFMDALCASANLSEEETNAVRQTASAQMTDSELKSYLDVLKGSELRFSFVSDVIVFAE